MRATATNDAIQTTKDLADKVAAGLGVGLRPSGMRHALFALSASH